MRRIPRFLRALLISAAALTVAAVLFPATPSAAAGWSPTGSLDSVEVVDGRLRVKGWAFDSDTRAPISIRVYADGIWAYGGPADGVRPDVGRVYPFRSYHGFDVSIRNRTGNICVYAINVGGGSTTRLGCRQVGRPSAPAPAARRTAPTGWIDGAATFYEAVRINGWAFDADRGGAPLKLHIYADGKFVTGVDANRPRPDVQRAKSGAGPNSGFDLILGVDAKVTQRICVYGIDQTSRNPMLGCVYKANNGSWSKAQPRSYAPLPAGSGTGRRIVYSNSRQRVWLVEANGIVADSYPVSGRAGTPRPGTYSVFSKSPVAWAGHDGITMRNMVRFAHGRSLAIGFHAIPRYASGRPLQSEGQLGTYRSAGCVRQADGNAAQLYNWAPIGTRVVVTR